MSKTASFLYKCRLCGETERNPHTGEQRALLYLTAAILNMNAADLTMLSIHSCKGNKTGVADLIGYEIED